MQGTNEKNEKKRSKTHLWGLGRGGGEMVPKYWESQQDTSRTLTQRAYQFQLPRSIWRVVMRGTNSENEKIEKSLPKYYFFGAVRQ